MTSRSDMASKTYTLTLTAEQAGVIDEALETRARLGVGQFSHAMDHLPLKEFYPDGWADDMRKIGDMLAEYTLEHVDGLRRSLSIHHSRVRLHAKIAWEMHTVIRRRLAWDRAVSEGLVASIDSPRNWKEMHGVSYDDPQQISGIPLPKIT